MLTIVNKIREFYKLKKTLFIMEVLYVVIGLVGAFIFGFLTGVFFGISKWKK